jgi:hypothetical protein
MVALIVDGSHNGTIVRSMVDNDVSADQYDTASEGGGCKVARWSFNWIRREKTRNDADR